MINHTIIKKKKILNFSENVMKMYFTNKSNKIMNLKEFLINSIPKNKKWITKKNKKKNLSLKIKKKELFNLILNLKKIQSNKKYNSNKIYKFNSEKKEKKENKEKFNFFQLKKIRNIKIFKDYNLKKKKKFILKKIDKKVKLDKNKFFSWKNKLKYKFYRFKILIYSIIFINYFKKQLLKKIKLKFFKNINLNKNKIDFCIKDIINKFTPVFNQFILKNKNINISLNSFNIDIFLVYKIIIEFLDNYLNFLNDNFLNSKNELMNILWKGFLPNSFVPYKYLNNFEISKTKFNTTGSLSEKNENIVFRMLIDGLLIIRILIFSFCFQSNKYLNEENILQKNINNLKTIGIILYNIYIIYYNDLKDQNNHFIFYNWKPKVNKDKILTINGISSKKKINNINPIIGVLKKNKLRNEFSYKGFWNDLLINYKKFSKYIFEKMIIILNKNKSKKKNPLKKWLFENKNN